MSDDDLPKKNKKTSKKTTKKTTKVAKGSSKKDKGVSNPSSPLMQAKGLLAKALKGVDWQTDLDPQMAKKSLDVISTKSIVINHLIGGKPNRHGVAPCPGVPRGKIFNLYGHEGSGKTTIALQTSAEAIREGGTVCYIDWEHEIVPEYALSLGVPIGDQSKFMLCQPDTLDDGIAVLWTMATAGVTLVVLDSVGAGVPKAFFEKAIKETAEQGRVGMNAAVWSAFLPKLKGRINKTHTAVIGISQIRDAINTSGYGDKITVQGGKAWKFYSAIRMKLQRIQSEKVSEYSALSNKTDNRVVGAKIRAKLDKCKVSPQQGNQEDFYIRWGFGVDDLRSLIEIGIAHRLVRKEGSWLSWIDPNGNQHRHQGMEKFRGFFDSDEKAHKTLEKQVMPFMASSSDGGPSDDGVEDELEEFGEDAFNTDQEIKDILGSISDDD